MAVFCSKNEIRGSGGQRNYGVVAQFFKTFMPTRTTVRQLSLIVVKFDFFFLHSSTSLLLRIQQTSNEQRAINTNEHRITIFLFFTDYYEALSNLLNRKENVVRPAKIVRL